MSNWLPKAVEATYPLTLNGKSISVSAKELEKMIKDKIKNSRALMNIFEQFEVSPDRLNSLKISFQPLEKKYAETDLNEMKINSALLEDEDFFKNYFFVIAHEIIHWLSRAVEMQSYFKDPEETLGFVSSIAYEMEQGYDFDTIWNRVYPKISFHFHNESDAREFFIRMVEKAKGLMK